MPPNTSTIAETIAQFAASCDYESIPRALREKARLHLLDAVGVALASSGFEFARRAYEGLRRFGTGAYPVIGMPQRLSLRDAACMNGILIHGIEYDDTSILGRIHPSASCVPAALAAGALMHASGKELLAAYVTGVECAIRIGAAAKGGFSPAGFNATGVVGGFGAVLTAGKLLGLDAERLTLAQGIVYGTVAGNREFVASDGWAKALDPGWAATAGITAASLASAGYVGARMPYEGKYGFYRVYLEHEVTAQDLELIGAGFGTQWHFEQLALKSLPSCFFNHPLINSTIAVMNRHDLVPAAIRNICVYLPRAAVDTVCEPAAPKYAPTDLATALFSVYFNVATAALRRRLTLEDLQPDALKDQEVLALARKVSYAVDAESTFPRSYSGSVEVVTLDGRAYSDREDVNKGSAQRPLSQAEVEAKFMANACRVLERARAQRMMEAILGIERAEDVNELPIGGES
jgi:2-methylcitrate dehydratase PrpD